MVKREIWWRTAFRIFNLRPLYTLKICWAPQRVLCRVAHRTQDIYLWLKVYYKGYYQGNRWTADEEIDKVRCRRGRIQVQELLSSWNWGMPPPGLWTGTAAAKSLQSCATLCDTIDGSLPYQTPRPWDSPGKNAGVGCHFLLQCRKVKNETEVTQSCLTLCDHMDCSLPDSY